MKEKQALVSCIMPTYNRRQFVPNAIQYFLRQDYQNKELIIIDDGTDLVADLIPSAENIRYYSLKRKKSLGAKLNMGCEYAKGNIIVNWDDDDWYAPWRLSYQMEAMQEDGIELCGINNLLYYDLVRKSGYNYIYPATQKVWLAGSSQCYSKTLWETNKFADINVGLDGLFVWATPPEKIKVLTDSSFSVHMIHKQNGSAKKTAGSWWHDFPIENLKEIIGKDWTHYENGAARDLMRPKGIKISSMPVETRKEDALIQNVFACLVHEKEDCILDLVKNLHYLDPDSHILLYNGSNNPELIKDEKQYEEYGAVWHPSPTPQKHGYLHGFALDCMAFAVKNFSFDTMTIVDSDQLCLRAGYSKYLSTFLSSKPNIGLLSSQPDRVTRNNRRNHVALQAYKEHDLWKPLLETFENGESSFVHWTFWPSTVITANAIRDLLDLFKTNKILQAIMAKTKIWATEEVIFPTLIKLLGYEIASNPCRHDYVKYKVNFGLSNMQQALKREDVYWMHPVERNYNNHLRKYFREKSGNYGSENGCITLNANSDYRQAKDVLVKQVSNIQGWLSNPEADMLLSLMEKALSTMPKPHHIVEVGSYHGKATVLMGGFAKTYFPETTIHAIDPHDGKLGAVDQGLKTFPPSLESFKRNIRKAGVTEMVRTIVSRSYDVSWNTYISVLFIDGLHDYESVSKDFHHFSKWISTGGYIAFHDYVRYFPGVIKFVDELLTGGDYKKVQLVGSLMVVQKL